MADIQLPRRALKANCGGAVHPPAQTKPPGRTRHQLQERHCCLEHQPAAVVVHYGQQQALRTQVLLRVGDAQQLTPMCRLLGALVGSE